MRPALVIANTSVLLKLTDGSEDLASGGPYFASMEAVEPAARPWLVIGFSRPMGSAR